MKRLFYVVVLCFLMLPLAACREKAKQTDGSQKVPASSIVEEQGEGDHTELPALVMLNDHIYQSTGYVNSALTCGTADGEITASVTRSETPTQNGQSNFGKGYKFQLGDENWLNVKIDNQWILFQNIAVSNRSMPEWVANFQAEITAMTEDRMLVRLTDISDRFEWIFDYQTKDRIKPIAIPISSLDNGGHLSETERNDMVGQRVRVWFDGQAEHIDPASSAPIKPGKVYLVEVVTD